MNTALIKFGQVVTPWINAENAKFWMDIGIWMFGVGLTCTIACVILSWVERNAQLRQSKFSKEGGFTLLELLTVMAIIVVLAAMILAGLGHAQQHSARSRTTAEIAAISTAIEAYKVDNGDYPRGPKQNTDGSSVTDKPGEEYIGILTYFIAGKDANTLSRERNYLEFKTDSFSTTTVPIPYIDPDTGNENILPVKFLVDPFGNPYGYSTKGTYNPTFDLWSTAGVTGTGKDSMVRWITNW